MRSVPRTKDTRTLLAAQLVFNIGFYAVVPFLAVAMRDDFGMQAAAIGLVLGARTFSQQGMFLVGGLLADRWGTKRAMLLGCLVRISGYATLAAATDFPLFLVGAILTGAGGAMFSRPSNHTSPGPIWRSAGTWPRGKPGDVRFSCGWPSPEKSVRSWDRCSARP
ncbi:MFS transporter [Paenarthrobacter sp. NPDC090522]|uniref:MFS transporter n=1 Tax=Paenarthrobacter sp. NPDC090522 TaxID=3364383 RepID=UPI00382DEFD2